MAGTNQKSLRECAMADAMNCSNPNAVKELQAKRYQRKLNKRNSIKGKTNVGDPNPSGNSTKARGK